MKDVLITIKGLHTNEENDDDNIELTTVGSLTEKNGKQYITYHESEEIGLSDVKTVHPLLLSSSPARKWPVALNTIRFISGLLMRLALASMVKEPDAGTRI